MSARPRRLAVRFLSGRLQGGVVPIRPGRQLLIGRQPGADLLLAEDLVSRRHAVLTYDGREVILEDLGSTNGTQVNGTRVTRIRLEEGDRILVGQTIFTIEGSAPSSPAAATQIDLLLRKELGLPTPTSAIQGRLDEVPLADLLQLVSTTRKSGVLELRGPNGEARIEVDRGLVVGCTMEGRDEQAPLKVLFRVFQWTAGHFELDPREPSATPRTPLLPSSDALLLEAARQLDEIQRLRASLPNRLEVTDAIPPIALDPADREIYDLVARFGDLDQILDASPLPDLKVAERLAALHERGAVVQSSETPSRARPLA
jgi:hypothetical protein